MKVNVIIYECIIINNDYSTSIKVLRAIPPLHNESKGKRIVYSWYTKG